ncbi:unnamed protein product [Mycena citricolor]|uniref:Adenylate cyclase n=1 Tax=Mycena citricolor TaxID=2018698 RepID=A0AAD2HUQ2_9AGAR|nr:unnamed protein product [Mycena citricolor]CAK5281118.1 unnamed protein product [Mycena citricolor]
MSTRVHVAPIKTTYGSSPTVRLASGQGQVQRGGSVNGAAEIAPWLESLDDVPPTPPPKPTSTYPSRQGSVASSSTSASYSTKHRPSTHLSVSTRGSIELDDSVDDYGQALMVPDLDLPPTHDVEIAPWLDKSDTEPPSPPAKNGRSFHFPPKNSFSSLRTGSTSNFFSRQRGISETPSSLSIAETMGSAIASTSTSNMHEPLDRAYSPSPELKKSKSSVFSSLRKKVSKKNMKGAPEDSEHFSLRPLPLNGSGSFVSFLPVPSPPQTPRFKKQKKKSSHVDEPVPPLPGSTHESLEPGELDIKLDLDFGAMKGIVDHSKLANGGNDASSPSSGFGSTSNSNSNHSDMMDESNYYLGGSPSFSNPFVPEQSSFHHIRRASRRVSPNTVLPSIDYAAPMTGVMLRGPPSSEGWTAPESWSVAVKDSVGSVEGVGGGDSDSDEGADSRQRAVPPEMMPSSRRNGTIGSLTSAQTSNGRSSHSHRRPGSKRTVAGQKMQIRVYKADGTYHVVQVPTNTTVAQLTPKLDMKLPAGEENEIHQLYLKERGRERTMAPTERPAEIVLRRLEQAGYDESDGQDLVNGAGLAFILKFFYKSQFLGPANEDLRFDNFEFIDLSSRSLRTIPVVLHQHADSIVSLRLSRNPMIEIPLDFIQSCTTLRELKLSNMSMKKVPNSLRHSTTLTRLDLSCNRISTLDEAYLDDIPGLTTLYVQNNRLENLPWSFPRMRRLITLNISNNKFRTFPLGVSELTSLRDLDISFNSISELPEEIGRLKCLERLVIVGNQVSKLPDEFSQLGRLGELDCRRNQITDLTVACMLPKIEKLSADHNSLHDLALSLGPCLAMLDASHNEITQLSIVRGPIGRSPLALTTLDISNAKLSLLDDATLGQFTSLRRLNLDGNSFRSVPDSLGELRWLESLSCANNSLSELPQSIGRLQKLETLDVHNNSLTELPVSLWNCASLSRLNVTSNLLVLWHDPPPFQPHDEDAMTSASMAPFSDNASVVSGPVFPPARKQSASSLSDLPPLAHSLELLYMGENSFTDEVLHPLMFLKELRVLNLSFNAIQDMPSTFFRNLTKLEEVYLSGNSLTTFPSEDLPKLTKLTTLFLNGNRLHTLPQELGKIKSLTFLDVGSNLLKYNINNWEFDWNWNFNKNLRYLNLSGNKRLQIKSDAPRNGAVQREALAGFSELSQLRVLGLMDVTITTTGVSVDIPDENDDRRVRTSSSVVNGMSYGIADTLGKNHHLNMLDLVHEFRGSKKDAIFAMFGRAQPPKQLPTATSANPLAKYLQENFVRVFISQLNTLEEGEGVVDALRRTFLKLNQSLHDSLFAMSRKMSQTSNMGGSSMSADLRTGASGVVVYIVDKKMYVANVGNALVVVSRSGTAVPLSRKHHPYDRAETARIRAAEGWVSPPGLVNDEIDISRSFGFYHLLPVINARPDVFEYTLTEQDEHVIIANRGLWDYVSYQTAVDIAQRTDPMTAAQKLRDFAISYGADGSTMIMVVGVADLFTPDYFTQLEKRKNKRPEITDRTLVRLKDEVPPPIGHVSIVFTDIKGSTHLWDANPGMLTAIKLHNDLLRRLLRQHGGYEVKTEGDSFMCSFPTALAAVCWCMSVQVELLNVPWPLEILECADGKTVYDDQGRLIARGLSVRMGIHCGIPLCEPDPITHRMDYFGPIVNRSSRIEGSAAGGHIMCSTDIIREINARIFDSEADLSEYSEAQPQEAIDGIRRLDPIVIPVGEVRLKGLEAPEMLSLVFPGDLIGRKDFQDEAPAPDTSGSRVQFSIEQMRELAMLCLRLEMPGGVGVGDEQEASLRALVPPMSDAMSDADLMLVLYSLMVRIENAECALRARFLPDRLAGVLADELDPRTLERVLAALRTM